MRKTIGIGLAALFLSAQATAETQFGVTVYPGAKADAQTAAVLKKQMNLTAHTYRTGDSVEKVTKFYRDQKLQEMPGADKQSAGFMAPGVHVTVQNPWMDLTTGKLNNDTLISIVKQR